MPKKYILKDIYSMEKNIKSLISGDYDIEFKVNNDTELRQISNVLNQWKGKDKYKQERMSRVLSAVNTHSAIFECVYGMIIDKTDDEEFKSKIKKESETDPLT